MKVYTYSEARQKLAKVLKEAESSGKVMIRRKDGSSFILTPGESSESPLDVPAISADIDSSELVNFVREGRERQP